MNASSMSEFRVIVKKAKNQGWRVEMTMGHHWKFVPPNPLIPIHIACSSPGDPSRFIRRLRCELRRKGLML